MISLYALDMLSRFVFLFAISYYSITLLQWYNYSLFRVITKHHKYIWYFFYIIIPLIVFIICFKLEYNLVFYIYLYIVYLPSLIYWTYKLDKRLVFTQRVWRFFGILAVFILLNEMLFAIFNTNNLYYLWFMPYIFAICISKIFESVLMYSHIKLATQKIQMMPNLKIIAITASFGKTSIKHFLAQILENTYNIHYTQRSINTFKGIVADINNNLNFGSNIYIVEAGARQRGDIAQIAHLINPHIAIIGEVGKAHIEYFKTIDNIIQTKFELLESSRLEQVFIHHKNQIPESKKSLITPYPSNVRKIQATLESTSFELEIDGKWEEFKTDVLGAFNVENIAVAIMVAKYLGVQTAKIQKSIKNLTPIPHRLNLSVSNGKTIIDDGFNGNLKGMLEGIRLCSLYQGRKVIITPGLIESDTESNINLGKAIDEIFDLAIITGEQNSKILSSQIKKPIKVILKDKKQLENVIKAMIITGDLVYFANDAPNYI